MLGMSEQTSESDREGEDYLKIDELEKVLEAVQWNDNDLPPHSRSIFDVNDSSDGDDENANKEDVADPVAVGEAPQDPVEDDEYTFGQARCEVRKVEEEGVVELKDSKSGVSLRIPRDFLSRWIEEEESKQKPRTDTPIDAEDNSCK